MTTNLYNFFSDKQTSVGTAVDITKRGINNMLPKTGLVKVPSASAKTLIFAQMSGGMGGTLTRPATSFNVNGAEDTTLRGDTASNRIRASFSIGSRIADGANVYNAYFFSTAQAADFIPGIELHGTFTSGTILYNHNATTATVTPSTAASTSALICWSFDTSTSTTVKAFATALNSAASSSSVTQGNWLDCGLTATITPTSGSSKLLIAGTITVARSDTGGNYIAYRIIEGSTGKSVGTAAGSRILASGSVNYTATATYEAVTIPILRVINSPGTTATNYKIEITHDESGGANMFINRSATDTDTTAFQRYCSQLNVVEILPA